MAGKSKIEWTDATWNPVPNFPGYCANAFGSIRGPSGRILRRNYKDSGHAYMGVRGNGLRRNLSVHRAVWTAFRGLVPEGYEVRHLNGDPSDNRLVNLAVGNRLDQRADDKRNGVIRRPLDLTLDEAKVAAILEAKGQASSRFVGELFDVSHTTIQKIWKGERWQSVQR